MEIRYSNPIWTGTGSGQCAAMHYNRESALISSARDLSDNDLQTIAVLITQRQVVARKLLALPDHEGDIHEVVTNTMDYINDELRKLLAL